MNQCSQPSWSKLNTAAMLHDVFSVTKTHYVLKTNNLSSTKIETICKVSEVICIVFDVDIGQSVHLIAYKLVLVYVF